MKIPSAFKLIILLIVSAGWLHAQAPSVEIKIKEKSGFLGMGGPRVIRLELSNQKREPITSENVNAGQYFYFICKPTADWKIDADFIKDDLGKLRVYQNEQKMPMAWKSDIIADATTSVLVAFPKTLKLNQAFLFQCPVGEAMSQIEMSVPENFWPGYSQLMDLLKQTEDGYATKQHRASIVAAEKILENKALSIFPQYQDAKGKRTRAFEALYAEKAAEFGTILTNQQLELKEKIRQIDGFKPVFQFFVDSLPRAVWEIGSLDATVAPILDRARGSLAQSSLTRDSLQHVLDDNNTKWIIEGSASGKNGIRYQYMIETLAYAFSSANFTDTAAAELKLRIPEEQRARLVKQNLMESYETFVRLCNERFLARMPIFPIEFLPNLRKDTTAFPLPYYSMLRAVNDFFYGSLGSAKEEILKIFRTCYEQELVDRFDFMRVLIKLREEKIPPEALHLLEEAEQLEGKKDMPGAEDKYRQASIVGSNFAYAFYSFAKHYVRINEPIRASTFFQRAYTMDTLYLGAYKEAYSLYLKQGTYKPMIEVLTLAIDKGNDYWIIHSNLGTAYMGDSDPARAIQQFEIALAMNGKSYKTNIQLGVAHQSLKNYTKAREFFNKAIDLDPVRQEAIEFMSKLNELIRTGK
jgi:tetratricopeptide (TPR) repeat protein